MKHLFFIIILLFTSSGYAVWEKIAELSYHLSNQECPSPAKSPASEPLCENETGASKNQADLHQLQEDLHFISLAKLRKEALLCAEAELARLEKTSEDFATWAQDAEIKLEALAAEIKTAKSLSEEIRGSQRAQSKLKLSAETLAEKRQALQESEARYAAIFQSIPFSDLKEFQKLFADQATDLSMGKEKNFSSFRNKLRANMKNTQNIVTTDLQMLNAGIDSGGAKIDRNLRESLAQDLDLSAALSQQQGTNSAVTCRIDAKYGKGAEIRDQALLAGSFLGSGMAVGLPRLARAGLLGRAAAGAAAGGSISQRSALIYRTAAFYLPASANAAALGNSISRSCEDDLSNIAGKASPTKNQCSQYSIANLDADNCVLEATLGAISGVSAISRTAAGKHLASYVGKKYRELRETDKSIRTDLSIVSDVSPAAAKKANQQMLDELNSFKPSAVGAKRKASLGSDEIDKLYKKVEDNPVSGLCNIKKYDLNPDPKKKIGFCFGRAMTAHLEALNSGIEKENVRKIWAVSPSFKSGDETWGWHVTTAVKGSDGKWWTIDPIMGKKLTIEDWYENMKSFDPSGSMQIFNSSASKFALRPGKYDKNALAEDGYNNYFPDLLEGFKADAKALAKKRAAPTR